MAYTPGGRADKFGNNYESLWVVNRLLDVLSETKVRSIIVEAIGELEEGVDLWVEERDGSLIAEQCKARNGSNESWSVSSLKNVISKIPKHAKVTNSKRFRLISPLSFTLLQDLCDDARMSEDPRAYYNSIVLKSKNKKDVFEKFCGVLKLNALDEKDQDEAYFLLRRFSIEQYQGSEATKDDLLVKIQFMFTSTPGVTLSVLRDYVISEKMLGKRIFADDLLDYLAKHEIYPKNNLEDRRLSVLFGSLKSDFKASIEDNLINDSLIDRKETQSCIQEFDGSDILIIHGESGGGKSAVLYQFVQYLDKENIKNLPIRLDRCIPKGSTRAFGLKLGLPDSPVCCLSSYVNDKPAVLILDQLDALRWTSESNVESINVCKSLIQEVNNYNKNENGNIKVVLVCRTFDLENDPELKNWLEGGKRSLKVAKIEISDLDKDDVSNIVGESFSYLSDAQIRILRNPRNLYMWLELSSEKSLTFNNTADLMRLFWRNKRAIIESSGVDLLKVDEILNKVIEYADKKGAISVPERILSKVSTKALESLFSNSVLYRQASRVMFCHQSYLDYLVAEEVLNEVSNGESIAVWLGKKKNQTLFKRQQLSILLFLLIDEDLEEFVSVVSEILFSDDIRFHIKHLVFEVFGQVQDLQHSSSKGLLVRLLNDQNWIHYVLKTVVIGNVKKTVFLIQERVIDNWFSSGSRKSVENALWVLRAVVDRVPDHVEPCLKMAFQKELITALDAYNCLSFNIEKDSPALFKFRIQLIKAGVKVNYIGWKKVAEENPRNALILIKEMFINHGNELKDNDHTIDRRLHEYDFSQLLVAAKREPVLALELFYSEALVFFRQGCDDAGDIGYNSFDIEKSTFSNFSYIDKYSNLMMLIVLEALKKLAEDNPKLLFEVIAKDISNVKDFYSVACLVFLCLPESYSDFVIEWILENKSVFTIGKHYYRPRWMLAADLIKRFSPYCSLVNFKDLESFLYSFLPNGDEYKNVVKNRLKFTRKGYFFPILGEAQYFLIPSLDEKRISAKTRNLNNVLKRKFDYMLERDFYNGSAGIGGLISSKLEPNIDRIKDKSWHQIIVNSDTPKKHSHSSWSQVSNGNIYVSSHSTFSSSLERAAKKEPRRFCEVFDKLPLDIDHMYISSMLSALSLMSADVNKSVELESWEKASVNDVERFWKKYRCFSENKEVARQYCWLMKRRSEESWPKWMIEDLLNLAKSHRDPELNALSVLVDGETYDNSSPDNLYSTTINSVRGAALEAVGALLWGDKSLFNMVENEIDTLLNEKHPAVLLGLHSIILPVLNIDRDKSLDWFLQITKEDLRIGCSRQAVNFFNYMISSRNQKLCNLIVKMLDSNHIKVVELAAEMIAYYTFCHGDMFNGKILSLKDGEPSLRKGVARALKNFSSNESFAIEARDLLCSYFDDSDKEVRRIVSGIFFDDNFLNNKDNITVAMKYVESKAFKDGNMALFRCISNYKGNIVDFGELILTASESLLKGFDIESMQYEYRFEQKIFVALIVRLYDQAEKNSLLREKCLDIWDIFFEKNIGVTRDITKTIAL
ncbi:hypothetical protein [Halobacteriovorax sp. CON-3]|uniref:hypothetical protein n=1 Tax=Halobacteriovorax sp. CON-3 TaxID=3157710 RepID=UPI0037160E5F